MKSNLSKFLAKLMLSSLTVSSVGLQVSAMEKDTKHKDTPTPDDVPTAESIWDNYLSFSIENMDESSRYRIAAILWVSSKIINTDKDLGSNLKNLIARTSEVMQAMMTGKEEIKLHSVLNDNQNKWVNPDWEWSKEPYLEPLQAYFNDIFKIMDYSARQMVANKIKMVVVIDGLKSNATVEEWGKRGLKYEDKKAYEYLHYLWKNVLKGRMINKTKEDQKRILSNLLCSMNLSNEKLFESVNYDGEQYYMITFGSSEIDEMIRQYRSCIMSIPCRYRNMVNEYIIGMLKFGIESYPDRVNEWPELIGFNIK